LLNTQVHTPDDPIDEGDFDTEARFGFPHELSETLNNGSGALLHREERRCQRRDHGEPYGNRHEDGPAVVFGQKIAVDMRRSA
jgi:hypothetical protein